MQVRNEQLHVVPNKQKRYLYLLHHTVKRSRKSWRMSKGRRSHTIEFWHVSAGGRRRCRFPKCPSSFLGCLNKVGRPSPLDEDPAKVVWCCQANMLFTSLRRSQPCTTNILKRRKLSHLTSRLLSSSGRNVLSELEARGFVAAVTRSVSLLFQVPLLYIAHHTI